MINFEEIQKLSKKKADLNQNKNDLAQELYDEAVICIKSFKAHNYSKDIIKEAVDKLLKVIERKSNKFEAYLCLAYIFFITNNTPLAIKYTKVAETFEPNSKIIQDFKDLFSKSDYELQKMSEEYKQKNIDSIEPEYEEVSILPKKNITKVSSIRRIERLK
jgi:Skp family chaperone for outer membrane proteins